MLFVVVSSVEVYVVFTQFTARYQNNYGNFKSLVSLTLPFLSCGFELVTVRCCVKVLEIAKRWTLTRMIVDAKYRYWYYETEMKWNYLEPCNLDWKLIVRNLSVRKPADCKKSFRQKTCMWLDSRKEWYISDESYSISQSLWSTRNNVLPFDLLPFPLTCKQEAIPVEEKDTAGLGISYYSTM